MRTNLIAASVICALALQGCASTVSVKPPVTDQVENVQSGLYLNSLPGDVSAVKVRYSYDPENRVLRFGEQDVSSSGENFGVSGMHERNDRTSDGPFEDCIEIQRDRYAPCRSLSEEGRGEVSLYYKPVYTPISGFFSTVLFLPIETAVAIPLSILTLDPGLFKQMKFPRYAKRELDWEKVRAFGTQVDRMLTLRLQEKYKAASDDVDPESAVAFLKSFPNHAEAATLRGGLPVKYRARGAAKGSSGDFVEAYKITKDRGDIEQAIRYASSDNDKARIEGALISEYGSKGDLVQVGALGDNFAGQRAGEGANVFIMNFGAKGVSNAKAKFRAGRVTDCPIPMKYGSYRVKVKFDLQLTHHLSGMAGDQDQTSHKVNYAEFLLRPENDWSDVEEVSFGEIVTSGGSSVFGYKIMGLELTGSQVSSEVVDVQPVSEEQASHWRSSDSGGGGDVSATAAPSGSQSTDGQPTKKKKAKKRGVRKS